MPFRFTTGRKPAARPIGEASSADLLSKVRGLSSGITPSGPDPRAHIKGKRNAVDAQEKRGQKTGVSFLENKGYLHPYHPKVSEKVGTFFGKEGVPDTLIPSRVSYQSHFSGGGFWGVLYSNFAPYVAYQCCH